jgi:hypothetical protein
MRIMMTFKDRYFLYNKEKKYLFSGDLKDWLKKYKKKINNKDVIEWTILNYAIVFKKKI